MKYGLIGTSIAYSLSPFIYRYWFDKYKIEATYDLIDIQRTTFTNSFINKLFNEEGYKGLNITKPFKEDAFDFLSKDSICTEAVKDLCCVNNIYCQENKIYLENTDYLGLLDSYSYLKMNVTNKNVLVLGCSGAAVAVVYSLCHKNNNIYLYNRTEAKVFNIIAKYPQENIKKYNFEDNIDIIFNATTLSFVEILKNIDLEIVKSEDTHKIFYDLNYYHYNNNLIRDGFYMLLFQASHNFNLWFGIKPIIDNSLISFLKKR